MEHIEYGDERHDPPADEVVRPFREDEVQPASARREAEPRAAGDAAPEREVSPESAPLVRGVEQVQRDADGNRHGRERG